VKGLIWIEDGVPLAIHEMVLSQHGGLAGLRDESLLESALAKPKNLFTYGNPTLPKLAASYASGIIRNHPFLDGNKRTGFLLASVFLERNGLILNATEESVIEATLALASGKLSETGYAEWLNKNSTKG
jgi:death-on-curing protein